MQYSDKAACKPVNSDAISESIIRIALAVGIGCVAILAIGIIIVSSAY